MNKKPMKVLGVAAVAALSLAVMAGCTPKDAEPTESSEPATSQSVETQAPDESVVKDADKTLPDETPDETEAPTDAAVPDEVPVEEPPAEDASSEAEIPADADAAPEANAGGEVDASTDAATAEGEAATDGSATEG